ncbi:MAG: pyrroline-5-carboxylate reductase [Armatimonadetes bacterium]|nr:pyrroline-5-carboxylate reductase [Armatimonadota bacterium]
MPLDRTVAVLGVGAMGSALVRGWVAAGVAEPQRIVVYDLAPERVAVLCNELGVRAAAGSAAAVLEADVVLLAVKPPDVGAALREAFGPRLAKSRDGGPPLLLSIAAGVPLAALESGLGQTPVIRVMPNTPAQVHAGASAFARGHHAKDEHAAVARTLLGAVGTVHEVKESLLNAVTGLSGSGPAYLYVAIEALADGGVRCGLPRDVAQALAAQTVLGAAKMVLDTGEHPARLKDLVASPGGTTIAGLASLESSGFRAALIEAVTAATRRADELSSGDKR